MVIFIFCAVMLLAVLLFAFGPQIIEAAVDKIDEWADIIDAFKEEK